MKIAIHHQSGFSDRWIKYCKDKGISYKIVDCYQSDIMNQIKDCDALMWHIYQASPKDFLFAKQLLFSVQASGKKVFPDQNTVWHFDDKLGQKYLLEGINAPFPATYAFYSRDSALEWAGKTTFPKVFKLRGGAGSINVRLVKNKSVAIGLINKAFGRGFQLGHQLNIQERYRLLRLGKGSWLSVFKGIIRLFIQTKFAKVHWKERGYILFQDFVSNNDSDTRVIIIGQRGFALKRLVRKDDFRASGSGRILYDKSEIDERCVKLAFDLSEKLKTQCIAYDFLFDAANSPLIVEISFGFKTEPYDLCPGYWDKKLNWHQSAFNPQEWMIEDLIHSI